MLSNSCPKSKRKGTVAAKIYKTEKHCPALKKRAKEIAVAICAVFF